jgi:hypothetical protein
MKSQATGSVRKPGFFQKVVSFFTSKTRKEHNKAPTVEAIKKDRQRKTKVNWGHDKLLRKVLRRQVFGGAAERMLARVATRKYNDRIAKLAAK